MRVLIFGDSIAQGFYDEGGGWVNRLRWHYDKIAVDNHDLTQPTIFNLGVSGDTTKNLLKRMDTEIAARQWPGEQLAIVIAIGTNDTLYRDEENETEPDKYKTMLSKLVKITQKYTPKVMFVGLFPVVDKLLQPLPWSSTGKCYSTERMKLFEDTLQEFCKESTLPIVTIWDVFQDQDSLENVFFDGIHPNSAGHQVIADTVRPQLEELFV